MELIYNWANENFDTLTQVFLVMILSYLGWKAKNWATLEDIREISFESEKGKNLATRDDIKEITEKVQDVKTLFNLKFHAHSNLWNEQRDAIAKFYLEYNAWRQALQSAGVEMVLESKIGQYNSLVHIRSLQEKRSNARAAFNGILLFVDDKKITEIAKEMVEKLKEIHIYIFIKLGKISSLSNDEITEKLEEMNLPEAEKESEETTGKLLSAYVIESRRFLQESQDGNK